MKFVSKWSEDLLVGDEFKIGNQLVRITSVTTTKKLGEMILTLDISGANPKKSITATLILPKKIPVEVLV